MLLADCTSVYRLSRSELSRHRALRRILRSDRETRRLIHGGSLVCERRREPRLSIQLPINLRPARVKGLSITADDDAPPFLALTSNISRCGLGYVHDEPFTAPICLAEFDVSAARPLLLVVQLCWTAQPFPYAYRSGGRILGVAQCGRVLRRVRPSSVDAGGRVGRDLRRGFRRRRALRLPTSRKPESLGRQ